MCQIEVYEWLKYQRKTLKNDDYFNSREVVKGLKETGAKGTTNYLIIGMQLSKLEADGYLDVVFPGKHNNYRRNYRIKKKYCRGTT